MYSRRRPDIGLLCHDDSNVERLYTCRAEGGLISGCCAMTTPWDQPPIREQILVSSARSMPSLRPDRPPNHRAQRPSSGRNGNSASPCSAEDQEET